MLDLPLNLYRLFHPFLVRGNTCICTFNEIKLLSQNSNSEMNYNFKCSLFRIATPCIFLFANLSCQELLLLLVKANYASVPFMLAACLGLRLIVSFLKELWIKIWKCYLQTAFNVYIIQGVAGKLAIH